MSAGLRVGVLGGGQLGLMLARAAGRLGLALDVLDPDANCPAAPYASRVVTGALDDPDALAALAAGVDVVTFEIEHVGVEPLTALHAAGTCIRPSPAVLGTIQDKLVQKRFLADARLPTSRFEALDAPSVDAVAAFGTPCVQKLRRGGYDGRGVLVVDAAPASDADLLPGPSLLEDFVACAIEVAVVVARRPSGEVATYPVVEMTFDAANVLDVLVAPARIEPELAAHARELAVACVEALDGVGVFGVELFVDCDGALWVNEIAPRVHNSGHFTLDACPTDQFEQHLRAVCDLPLGDTRQHSPAVMVNVLGAGGPGASRIDGLADALALPGVALHWYNKRESRPGRKMGHMNVVGETLEQALATADAAKGALRVVGDTSSDGAA